ncbi:hypothetical protein DK261_19485 [Pseudomonas sp. RW409]|nr:hypothetical protein DK261_19485 [Pseudomonas sp. RW409]
MIVNARAFQERVIAAIKRENFDATAGLVSYYDAATFNGNFADEKIPFNKRDSYQHQREYRIALDRPDADGGPFTLEVGSLRDICAICPTSEINPLVEDCLQQLYRQGVFD